MNNGWIRVYRRRGEKFAANFVLEADGNRGRSVMIFFFNKGGGRRFMEIRRQTLCFYKEN